MLVLAAVSCRGGAAEDAVVLESDFVPLPVHSFETSGPVEFSARVSWEPDDSEPLKAFLEIGNPGDSEVLFSSGACGFGLRAYRNAPPNGLSVWDHRPPPLGPNQGWACPDIGFEVRIAPGSSEVVPVHDFGFMEYASLPEPGRYIFAIVLQDRREVVYLIPTDTVEISRPATPGSVERR